MCNFAVKNVAFKNIALVKNGQSETKTLCTWCVIESVISRLQHSETTFFVVNQYNDVTSVIASCALWIRIRV